MLELYLYRYFIISYNKYRHWNRCKQCKFRFSMLFMFNRYWDRWYRGIFSWINVIVKCSKLIQNWILKCESVLCFELGQKFILPKSKSWKFSKYFIVKTFFIFWTWSDNVYLFFPVHFVKLYLELTIKYHMQDHSTTHKHSPLFVMIFFQFILLSCIWSWQ